MFKNSIDEKPVYVKPNGESVKDLTKTMVDMTKSVDLAYSPYRVPKDYVMRPDLISQAVYNSPEYAEIILKFNGISNPFTINEGDVILVPSLEAANDKLIRPASATDTTLVDLRNSYKYIDPLKIPTKSKELATFDNRQLVNVLDGALPPNIAEENTTQVTRKNGRVYFGDSVATCVKNGISSSEFLAVAIQNKKT